MAMAIPGNMAREMVDEVIEFTRSYTIWRELMEKSHSIIRTTHTDFFLTVTNSMVLAFCVGTYQLFDKNSRTKSLCRLIADLRPSDAALAQRLDSQIKGQEPILEILFHIRNNVYGHRNKSKHPRDIFADAKLTPAMMKSVVQLAPEVVSAVAVASGAGKPDDLQMEFRDHERYVLEDTREVLIALQNCTSECLS